MADKRECPHCGLDIDTPIGAQIGLTWAEDEHTPVDARLEKMGQANAVLREHALEIERRERLRLDGELAAAQLQIDDLRLRIAALQPHADELARLRPAYDQMRLEFNKLKAEALRRLNKR